MAQISQHTYQFLIDLTENNHKEWFDKNRPRYERSKEEMEQFVDELLEICNTFDVIETPSGKKSLHRIYRDIRFSKDKTPYKSHWGGSFRRAGASRRGGIYYHIQPGHSFIGGGFWGPNKEDLLLIRKQIEADADPLREVLNSQDFTSYFGELLGDQLKTAPKGFDKTHPNIDLLRYKQFIVKHSFTDEEVLSEKFVEKLAEGYEQMLPYLNVMTDYLTTDLNGISTI